MSNLEIQYWQGSRAETDKLRALCEVWKDEFWKFEEILNTLKTTPCYLAYCEDPKKWNGFLFAQEQSDAYEIMFVFCDPKNRRSGYGTLLLEDLQAVAKIKGKKIFLEVKHANVHAIALYEKCGFRRVRFRKNYYKDGSDALIYEWK